MNLQVNFKKHQEKVKKIAIIPIVAIIFFITKFLVLFYYFEINARFTLVTAHVYQLLHNYFYTAQFSCAALAIRERLKMLNEYSSSFVECKARFRDKIVVVRQEKFNLKLFSKLYNDLCDLIELSNETFTWQLIIVMTNLLMIDIFAFYGILREFIVHNVEKFKFLILANTTWCTFQFLIKFFMAYCGKNTTGEAEKSLVIITRLVEQLDRNDQLTVDLNLLLGQMRGRNKKLENVFFTINYKLILAVS